MKDNTSKQRKSKMIYDEAQKRKQVIEEQLTKLNEQKKLLAEAEEEEKRILIKTDERIQRICNELGMRCGISVTNEVVNQFIEALIKNNGKPVFVKANLEYYDEE